MAKKKEGPQIISAHRLRDGRPVFLGKDVIWQDIIDNAVIVHSEKDLETLMVEAKNSVEKQEVVEPYALSVTHEGNMIRPDHYRERIRALGPSILPEFHLQPSFAALESHPTHLPE